MLAAFRIAIDKEEEAAQFYTQLAEQAEDPETRRLFHKFAADETSHRESLKELYATLPDSVPPAA